MPKKQISFFLILVFLFGPESVARAASIRLSDQEIQCIAQNIFMNECAGDPNKLVYWNPNEPFMSLGIGHFIWFPKGIKTRFKQSFPEFLKFLETKGVAIPIWMTGTSAFSPPWNSRDEFLNQATDQRLEELRVFLESTKDYQALFIIERLKRSLPRIIKYVPKDKRASITRRFRAVALAPGGLYALADYTNFKGEGLDKRIHYKGHQWGLKQVLESMRDSATESDALEEFTRAAVFVLERRVKNAPNRKVEKKWLIGWKRRIASYKSPTCIG